MTPQLESDLSEYMSGLAMLRAQLCRLTSILFVYPDSALKRAFADGPLWEQCVGLARVMGDDVLTEELERARKDAAVRPEEWFRELRVEYTRLFCQAPLIVNLYGAQYVNGSIDEEHAVLCHYARAGMVLRKDFRERADHIAAEFDFLFYLAHAEALAWGQGDHDEAREWQEMQRTFYTQHLKLFAAGFADSLADNSASPFYVFAARLVQALTNDAFFE